MTLDELAGESPVIRFLARYMRDGKGMSLHAAIREAEALGLDPRDRLPRYGASKIAMSPSRPHRYRGAVVAGNIE